MALKVTFELTNSDLKHFKKIMREAREAAKSQDDSAIIGAAASLLRQVAEVEVPEFVSFRLEKLQTMIDMLQDEEWKMPALERGRVLNALTYFAEPDDLIPDHIPALGFLDDAIMVELVVRELRHEIEAYRDFCRFREAEEAKRRDVDDESREDWLSKRRKALHERMRRRNRRDRRGRRAQGGPRITLF